ncbi:apoptosis-inducing factor 1, mitochondrial [Agrilus planipennis]|uniref:Apoptosis-inducing factor 1, mitochondrial n=1 Tax=Agrilus planipennis TaxID=224129 RepID=A0A1W4WGV9_AGRPL|nr:apoptosis-inducing factor 1, mitochondrial [Agrilus planipennis]
MRPPLSKEIWFNEEDEASKLVFKQWNGSERSLFYEPPDFYMNPQGLLNNENGGVSVARGWTVKSLDVENRTATLDDGYVIEYEKCLIATGARPKNLDIFTKAPTNIRERVTTYRDICDFEELREIAKEVKSLAVIGGGFLGSELACSLARFSKRNNAATITQIFREAGNLGKILPQYLSEWTTEKVKAEGVNVLANAEIVDVNLNEDDRLVLTLGNGKELVVDHAVVAIGVQPNTDLAQSADLEVDPEQGGYLVNTELQARTNLYIAGDCACFYDPRLGRRRVEHHDHAVVTGRLAGENMTGAAKPYVHQSMLWSDLGPDVGFEAIGVVDSSLPTVGVFAKCTTKDTPQAVVENTGEGDRSLTEQNAAECPPSILNSDEQQEDNYGKGVVFYLRDGVIVGIVLWNVFNRMQVARQVLKEERKYDDLNEVAKLFNIHDD